MAFIKLENVSFSYDSESGILKDISLEIQKGEFISIIGHNGSGKSTLSKLFNGILIPTEGKVLVNGMDTAVEENIFDIRKSVGMVFQNPDNQIVATVVEEDIAFGPENLGVPSEEIRKRVTDSLKTVGLEGFERRSTFNLSGGQKQRLAIAGILAMQSECIVLDEPTAMLDPLGREEVISTIHRLNKEKGITVILVTHYMNEAAQSDRVIVMNDGRIDRIGTAQEIFTQVEYLKQVGLDVPQPAELLHILKNNGIEIPYITDDMEKCADILEDLFKN